MRARRGLISGVAEEAAADDDVGATGGASAGGGRLEASLWGGFDWGRPGPGVEPAPPVRGVRRLTGAASSFAVEVLLPAAAATGALLLACDLLLVTECRVR